MKKSQLLSRKLALLLLILCSGFSACSSSEITLMDDLKDQLVDAIADEAGSISKTAASDVKDFASTAAAVAKETAQAVIATEIAEVGNRLRDENPDPWDTLWLPNDSEFVAENINNIVGDDGLAGEGSIILMFALEYGVNPAFALAMFQKEANFARKGTIANAYKNPGNIIATGDCWGKPSGSLCTGIYGEISTDGRFGIYESMQDGIKAYFMLLAREYKPGTTRNCSDIECIINSYAPSSENNTALYVDQVSRWTKDFQQKILGR